MTELNRKAPMEIVGIPCPGGNVVLILGEEQEWNVRANCLNVDPDLFFPEKGRPSRDAKRVCAGCEVRRECLLEAIVGGIHHGIWGGYSERQRRGMEPGRIDEYL